MGEISQKAMPTMSRVQWVLFLLGLVIRLWPISFFLPAPQAEWFAPFMQNYWHFMPIDPWTSYIENTGGLRGFPYGIAMFVFLLPCTAIASLIGGCTIESVGIGIRLTLLLADLASLLILRHILPKRRTFLLVLWWLSPITLASCYWTGQLDIIPVCMLLISIFNLQQNKYRTSGVFFALAVSCKLSMALAAPFLLVYFMKPRLRHYAQSFMQGCIPLLAVLLALPALSTGYIATTLGTPELARFFDLRLPLGESALYLTPIVLTILIYVAWRIPFLNFNLLTSFVALGMLCVVLSTSTPPGWQLWAWPFLIIHLSQASFQQKMLGLAFAALACLEQILFWPPPANATMLYAYLPLAHEQLYALIHSMHFCMGYILAAGILRNGIKRNDMYRFGTRPVSIAIAGDSGTGKDTLAINLRDLFPVQDTTHISGDNYHRWDRKGGAWKGITHLNPRANDLKQLFSDINTILSGKRIRRRHYQHDDGHFSEEFFEVPRHFFIASGLHILISDAACKGFDLHVFMEMDNALRTYFKCRRDINDRGYTKKQVEENLAKRKADSKQYIVPQRVRADIVFRYCAKHPEKLDATIERGEVIPPGYLEVYLRHSLYHETLVRELVGLYGLHVDMQFENDTDEVMLVIDGDIGAEDIALTVTRLVPELKDMLAVTPVWKNNIQGLMQLICLCHLAQNLKTYR